MLKTLAPIAILSVALTYGCSSDNGASQNQDTSAATESQGIGNREGEKEGTGLSLTESYDTVQNGIRLLMKFDTTNHSFTGSVENTTEKTIEKVRVEVHLSNDLKLGPTNPVDLKPGEKRFIQLIPPGEEFTRWTAHTEVGDDG